VALRRRTTWPPGRRRPPAGLFQHRRGDLGRRARPWSAREHAGHPGLPLDAAGHRRTRRLLRLPYSSAAGVWSNGSVIAGTGVDSSPPAAPSADPGRRHRRPQYLFVQLLRSAHVRRRHLAERARHRRRGPAQGDLR
jgi:hypothetical protein